MTTTTVMNTPITTKHTISTPTTTTKRRAIDVSCPECGARPGSPCKGSRIPSAGSLGGGWGGPPARKRPHAARKA